VWDVNTLTHFTNFNSSKLHGITSADFGFTIYTWNVDAYNFNLKSWQQVTWDYHNMKTENLFIFSFSYGPSWLKLTSQKNSVNIPLHNFKSKSKLEQQQSANNITQIWIM
jgi:hypothetical protein